MVKNGELTPNGGNCCAAHLPGTPASITGTSLGLVGVLPCWPNKFLDQCCWRTHDSLMICVEDPGFSSSLGCWQCYLPCFSRYGWFIWVPASNRNTRSWFFLGTAKHVLCGLQFVAFYVADSSMVSPKRPIARFLGNHETRWDRISRNLEKTTRIHQDVTALSLLCHGPLVPFKIYSMIPYTIINWDLWTMEGLTHQGRELRLEVPKKGIQQTYAYNIL